MVPCSRTPQRHLQNAQDELLAHNWAESAAEAEPPAVKLAAKPAAAEAAAEPTAEPAAEPAAKPAAELAAAEKAAEEKAEAERHAASKAAAVGLLQPEAAAVSASSKRSSSPIEQQFTNAASQLGGPQLAVRMTGEPLAFKAPMKRGRWKVGFSATPLMLS